MPKIKEIKDNIVTIEGKENYEENQKWELSKDSFGIVLKASQNSAKLIIIGNINGIKINSIVKKMKNKKEIEVYEHYFGKIISPFEEVIHPKDFKEPDKPIKIGSSNMDNPSPGVLERVRLSEPIKTGLIALDTLIPIGKGQRELIIGNRSSGKTTIAISTILNQKDNDLKIIYVGIGQKRNNITTFYNSLKELNSIDNLILIYSNPNSPGEQLFAPKIGMAMAEAIAYKGNDVLIILDDLTKHSNIYREISLSIGISPGREAYPTDIFYQHSSLLERAGRFSEKYNNSSITCIPIVETIQNDVASLIPSNIISITDGQIFTSDKMFNEGIFPSIDILKSVSRLGSSVQSPLMQAISKNLKKEYSSLSEISKFVNMSIDINEKLSYKIEKWESIKKLFIQNGLKGFSEKKISILVILFQKNRLGKIINYPDFSIAYRNFCKNNKLAKMILNRINHHNINEEKMKNQIDAIFGSFAKAASKEYGDSISSAEYKQWKRME